MPVRPRQFHGRRRVVASTRQPAVTRELEYLEEALQEAEAAARWYAERSVTAGAGFSDEIDAAESAIVRLPEASARSRNTPVPASTLSVQRRLSSRSSPHPDCGRGARASPTRILAIATVAGGLWCHGLPAQR